MSTRTHTTLLNVALWLLASVTASVAVADQQQLDQVHMEVARDFPRVSHIDADDVASLAAQREVMVFDVREPDEFAVSHLDGAIQVDPRIGAGRFLSRYGKSLQGKDVLFYCSVGRRSSLLADRVVDDLRSAGSGDVYNLRNGIFGWHNNEMPLISEPSSGQKQITQLVHPFNSRWGKLLVREQFLSYKPQY